MSGYSTRKRTSANPFQYKSWVGSIKPSGTIVGNNSIPEQTTYSFRTGGYGESSDSNTLAQLGEAQTLAGRRFSDSFDTGHEFDTVNNQIFLSHPKVYLNGSGSKHYEGPLDPTKNSFARFSNLPDIDVVYYGNKAIKNTVPNNPVAGLAASLGELHEGLPRLMFSSFFGPQVLSHLRKFRDFKYELKRSGSKQSKKALSHAGNEWLNVQFGWLPMINDLVKTMSAVINAANIIEQFRQDSGRIVRRQYVFPVEVTSSIVDLGSTAQPFYPVITTSYIDSATLPCKVTQTTETVRKVSFSGAYTYYLDFGDSTLSRLNRYRQYAEKLLGLELTPEVLWELAPWSWLADWILAVQDSIIVADRFQEDGLVMRYGYLMVHTVKDITYTVTDLKFLTWNPGPVYVKYRSERKQRVKATPFGFGLNPSLFTARQWSILGALGLTKAPTSLRTRG